MKSDELRKLAATNRRESKHVEFKSSFNTRLPGDWCEVIKDIVAMANSGGGVIVFGINDDGSKSTVDNAPISDVAVVTDKLRRYTSTQFGDIELATVRRGLKTCHILLVGEAMPPIVFENPGTYPDGSRQKTAFARGTVYFRHGAKSEPAIQDDMRNSFERLLSRRQRGILKDVRRIVTAPSTHIVQLVPVRNKLEDPPSGSRIRVVEAADAPSGRLYSVDDTHPYRLKDVIAMVNKRLEGRVRINQHDMRCVRLVFGIDEKKPAYYHRPRFSSPQYSDAYVDWLVESYVGDPEWFEKARQRFAKM